MNFSQTYLGKSLEELTYKDIEEFFIEEQVETETLEFKSGELFKTINEFKDSLNKNINRSITAFLNSSGGLLIWGAPREYKKDGTNIKYCKGELYPINISRDKDSLISEITRAISHMPIGIKVKILSSEDGKSHIYIFEVKESQSKPHQSNHRYFIRLDGQTQDAPHYLVQALFNQITYPHLEGYLKFRLQNIRQSYKIQVQVFIINFSELQNEENLSYTITSNYGDFGIYPNPIKVALKNVLHYKREFHKVYTLQLPLNNFDESRIEVVLFFGGKKSPAKESRYIIELDTGTKSIKSLNVVLENKLYSEIDEENRNDKAVYLRRILDR